jgi:hypothetical protein
MPSTPDGRLWGCSDVRAQVSLAQLPPAQAAPGKVERVDRLQIERLGGLAGFGGPGGRIKSKGEIGLADLSAADRQRVEDLFAKKIPVPAPKPDAFRYRITRQTPQGPETMEAPEEIVPQAVRDSVHDTLE